MKKVKMKFPKMLFEFRLINIFMAFGIVACMALSIMSSFLLGKFTDLISGKSDFDYGIIAYLVSLFGVLLLTVIANVYLAQYLPLRLQLKKSIAFSREVMDGLLKIPQKYYQREEKGYYINLITSSAFTCGDIYGQINVELVWNAICVLLLTVIAACINPYLGVIYLLYIPIFAVLTRKPNKKIADFQKAGLPTQDAFLSGTKKIIENKREINIARAESYYSDLYKERSGNYLSFAVKFKWYSILSANMPAILSVFLKVITMAAAIKLYFSGDATLGTILVIFQLSQLLQDPINKCFEILIHRMVNDVHIERIQQFINLQHEKSGFEDIFLLQNELALIKKGKLFSTPERTDMLFTVNDLLLPKNSLIVIKGSNGTGKSTLTNLLTGFIDIDIFDGILKLNHSLSKAAYLSHPILFAEGDIKENMFGAEINQDIYSIRRIN